MRTRLLTLIVSAVLSLQEAQAQATAQTQDGYKPYFLSPDDSQLRARGSTQKSPAAYTSTYVLVYRGPQGTVTTFQGTGDKGALEDFSFPSVNFVFSAAAKLMNDDILEPGKIEGKWLSEAELRKLNVNIRIRGLDSNKKPMLAPRRGLLPGESASDLRPRQDQSEYEENPHVVVLALTPSDSQFKTAEGNVSKEMTSIDVFTRFMGPFAGVASGATALFKNWFRTKDTPTQVAYLSSDDEFGWTWRDAESFGIEGIHQCSAALRTRREVKYIQVHLELITDWRRFGAWMRSGDYIIQVGTDMTSN